MLKIRRIKLACYTTNVCMAIIANLPPILFVTFHNMYDISYSLLGLLVLINFCTQLLVDLIFSFYSHKFNIELVVKLTPIITLIGFAFYALIPLFWHTYAYVGLVIGSIIFSASSGLSEVLMSPIIAALPSDNPDKAMSALHSVYAWGVVFVVILGTLFLWLCGRENWYYLVLIMMLAPLIAIILFAGVKLPTMTTPEKASSTFAFFKNKYLWLSIIAIFIGGASECTMAQWSSTYLEQALGIPKVYGDIFGVALFSVMLAIGRTLYAKVGKNIEKVLFVSISCTFVTYIITALSPNAIVGLISSAMTGLFVAMLWPGNIIITSKRFPNGGVFIFAIMAAAGDLGASVLPQAVGIIADGTIKNPTLVEFATKLGLTPEQLGLKIGILIASVFALIGILVFGLLLKLKRKFASIPSNEVTEDSEL